MSVKAGRFAMLSTISAALRGARAPGAPSLGDRVRAVPRMVRSTVTGRYKDLSPSRLGMLTLGAVYVVSPVDLLPELVLPLIGLGDDLVVLTFVVSGLLVETEKYLAWEHAQEVLREGSQGVVAGEVVEPSQRPRR